MFRAFYITSMIGEGSNANPYRCRLYNYTDVHTGEWYTDSSSVSRLFTLAYMEATEATHQLASSDQEIFRLTPLCETKADLIACLNEAVGTIPQAVIDKLETFGINCDQLQPSHLRKKILRHVIKNIFMTQRAEGQGDENFKQFLKANLDTRIGDLSLAIRQRAEVWMQEKGLDTGWINANTLVREVLHYISDNTNLPVVGFGGANL